MASVHTHNGGAQGRARLRGNIALAALGLTLALAAPAQASKQIVDYFGTPPGGVSGGHGGEFKNPTAIAVNQSGAGPAEPGEIYVLDSGFSGNNRVERFSHDDNGTAEPYDDTFSFVSTWGTDVVQDGGTGDVGDEAARAYEICTVAAECKAGVPAAGNGTATGNGDIGGFGPQAGIAVDQDSGDVYVSDTANHRVNVYSGDGTFLRSFGYDVAESGPGDLPGAAEQQKLTVKASGGKFALLFGGQSSGATGTGGANKGSKTLFGVNTTGGEFAVGQAFQAYNPNGLLTLFPSGTTIAAVGEGSLTVSKAALQSAHEVGETQGQLYSDDLLYNASAAEVEASLEGLPAIGGAGGSVDVTRLEKSAEEFEYTVEFGGALAGVDLPPMAAHAGGLTIGAGSPAVEVEESVRGGAYEVCDAAAGDVCRAGGAGDGVGEAGIGFVKKHDGALLTPSVRGAAGIALSAPDGNPATGSVFLADTANHRVNTYDLDGSAPSSFGSSAVFTGNTPSYAGVDSRGIVYLDSEKNGNEIERYDSEGANGEGVGFLAPIGVGFNERQQFTIAATAGTFRLCFEGSCSADLPYNAGDNQIRGALEALPTIGPGHFACCSFGGPGDVGGSHPYKIGFAGGLGAEDVPQVVIEDGSVPLSGGAGAGVTTTVAGQPGLIPNLTQGFAVAPDPDGAGPEGDVLYVRRDRTIQQFGPLNAPGLGVPPGADDDRHGDRSGLEFSGGLALDQATGLIYDAARAGGGQNGAGVYLLFNAGSTAPEAAIEAVGEVTARSAVVHAEIDPNGPPALSYRFEYSGDGGASWKSTPSVLLGAQETPQSVEEPLPLLEPATGYEVRLIAQRPFVPAVEGEASFTTLPSPPEVETTGAPVRTANTARLEGRVNPAGNATAYRFEYGTAGPCGANPCEATEAAAAGSEDRIGLVSRWVGGLAPATVYHYRVIGESECEPVGNPGHVCVAAGEDMTLTTAASDAPLSHGHYPGPPGSDRAYEQVNAPDIGGNPLGPGGSFSENGDRVIYGVEGGTPFSEAGSAFGSFFFTERRETAAHAGGWQTRIITPPRQQLIGKEWRYIATGDVSAILGIDYEFIAAKASIWRISPDAQPVELFESTPPTKFGAFERTGFSADGSRAVMLVGGGELDPAYPEAATQRNLYDITSATPKLLSLLAGNAVAAACGIHPSTLPPSEEAHWVSADGSRVYFEIQSGSSGGCGAAGAEFRLYMREIDAEQTKLISRPPLSGPECGAVFVRSTDDAVFFWTRSRLVAADVAPAKCTTDPDDPDGDVYRYELADGSLRCVTCVVAGVAANVPNHVGVTSFGHRNDAIAVAEDGSRVYFEAQTPLVPGAPANGLYRVDLAGGDLAYVGPSAVVKSEAQHPMTPDGSALVFESAAAALNPLGGADNGGSAQYYRYDDRDRSLICVSCAPDGAPPAGAAFSFASGSTPGLSHDGATVAFTTPTALVGADQNTPGPGEDPEAGTDAYEWRDGRPLLISDGLTGWPPETSPSIRGMSASGRDVFFAAPAEYTPDALDSNVRLYDARIGGGFDFPAEAKPCPLEVCQGTPRGAPEEAAPGSADFRGPGNVREKAPQRRCRKGKVRRRGRCVAKPRESHRKPKRGRHATQGVSHDRRITR